MKRNRIYYVLFCESYFSLLCLNTIINDTCHEVKASQLDQNSSQQIINYLTFTCKHASSLKHYFITIPIIPPHLLTS